MKKKSIILGLTGAILIASMAVGGTLAYFTNTQNANNTFTVGKVEIKFFEHQVTISHNEDGSPIWVYQTGEDDNRIEVNSNSYEGIYPGAYLPKDPTIRNTGSNPAYVRIKVTFNNASQWMESLSPVTDLRSLFNDLDTNNWAPVDTPLYGNDNTITYVFNYKGALSANKTAGPLFSSVTIPTKFDNAEMQAVGGDNGKFTINMTAEAIQSEGFNGDETAAFTALDTQSPPSPTPTPN